MPNLPTCLSVFLFALLLLAATLAWDLPWPVAAAYLMTSITCFAVHVIDKAAARNGAWRTPERTLLLLGLAGGWPGGLLAQQWLCHKTSKASFRRLFRCMAVANVLGFLWLSSTLAR